MKEKLIEKIELAILQDEILVKFYESLKENMKEKKDIAQMDLIIDGKKKEIEFNKNYVKFASTL
jgi:hypothetical protein